MAKRSRKASARKAFGLLAHSLNGEGRGGSRNQKGKERDRSTGWTESKVMPKAPKKQGRKGNKKDFLAGQQWQTPKQMPKRSAKGSEADRKKGGGGGRSPFDQNTSPSLIDQNINFLSEQNSSKEIRKVKSMGLLPLELNPLESGLARPRTAILQCQVAGRREAQLRGGSRGTKGGKRRNVRPNV